MGVCGVRLFFLKNAAASSNTPKLLANKIPEREDPNHLFGFAEFGAALTRDGEAKA